MSIIKKPGDYILEGRINPRVKENRLLAWETQNGNIQGRARIRNISLNGMLIETTSDFEPYSNCIFSFDSDLGHDNYIPQNGRLVWHQVDERKPDRKLCGIQFYNRSEFVTKRLDQRIQKFFSKKLTYQAVSVAADAMGCLFLVALVGFIIWTSYEIYFNMQKSNQQLASITTKQAEIVRENYLLGQQIEQQKGQIAFMQDELLISHQLYQNSKGEINTIMNQLAETRSILTQTQIILDEMRTGNGQLQADMLALQKDMKGRQSEFEDTLMVLEDKNQQLVAQMRVLDKQLLYYSGNINSIEEGERWFDMYEQSVRKVKAKIRHFKKQAKAVRNEAERERDRIRMILGNNGYFTKNGQNVKVDMEKYNNVSVDSIMATSNAGKTAIQPRVEIDVNFYR